MNILVKRAVSSFLGVAVFTGAFGLFFKADAATRKKGDMNGDGKITISDARKVLRLAADMEEPTAEDKTYADFDGDGLITAKDAQNVLKLSVEVIGGDYRKQLIEAGFPESYLEPLTELHAKYPDWRFTPFITGLTWEEAVTGEHTPHNKQLVENNALSEYKCKCSACDGVFQESGWWVSASEYAVEHYLDPRNFLTEKYIFQFEDTTYTSTQTADGVEAILKGTWMYKSDITYLDASGTLKTYKKDGKTVKYSAAVMNAAKASGMSAYYLASKIVQEVGGSSASAGGASGKVAPYKGIYNYYNIGAYTGALDGLEWANGYMCVKSQKTLYKTAATTTKLVTLPSGTELYYVGTSGDYYKVTAKVSSKSYTGFIKKTDASLSTTYGRPWTDPYKSIYYGAKYINSSFSQYQYTGYLQKFNVNKASDNLYYHEYMGNIQAAASEAANTYYAYKDGNILSAAKNFSIPVFENMNPNPASSLQIYVNQHKVKNLHIVSSTNTSVKIAWDKLECATGYRVYKYDFEKSEYVKLKDVTGTSYTDSTVKKGEKVKYCIKGYNNMTGTAYFNSKGPAVTYKIGDVIVVTLVCPYAEPSVLLGNGDSGNGVMWLQWHLYQLGYFSSTSDIDGIFGSGTETAVRKFQKSAGIEVDGIVGSGTRAALKKAI